MVATHFTGKDGEVKVDGNVITVVDFNVDVAVDVITSPRVGKVSDKNYPGKKHVSGSISQVVVTPELLSYVLGDSDTLTTSSLETLLAETDISGNTRQELSITSDPTNPTSVKVTLQVGDENSTAGSIVIHGKDSSAAYVAEVINFDAMTVGDPAQVKYGSQQFADTDYVDISANLQHGTGPDTSANRITIEGITGTKTMTPGTSTYFDIIGKVIDPDDNYAQVTLNNCFFTAGNFPIGDSNTLVQCDLPFIVQDPDEDVTLVWTST